MGIGTVTRAVLTLLLLAVVLLPMRPAVAQGQGEVDVEAHVLAIRQKMQQSLQALRAGDRETAYRLARSAYLDHFELVEIPLRIVDARFTLEMELLFARWRSAIREGAPEAEVLALMNEIDRGLEEVGKLLTGPGVLAPVLALLASFAILFREGVEAILVLSAVLGILRVHTPAMRRPLWIGALLALPGSALTWFLLTAVLRAAPVSREVLEAGVSLVAVAFLFYISFWLLQRLEVRHWLEFVRGWAWEAGVGGNRLALLGLGFLIVYREGAETVLFYQVLLWMAERLEVWVLAGALLAGIALVGVGWGLFTLGARVPFRPFLAGASALVMLISVSVLGNAVSKLQTLGVVPFTYLPGFPSMNPFLADLLGLHPSLETLLAQVGLLLVYLVGGLYYFWWMPTRVRESIS